MSKRAEPSSLSAGAVFALVAPLVVVLGCNAAVGGGVLVVGVVAGIVTYDCAEGVGVTVRDHMTAHPVCDATVVAQKDGKSLTFSPCYSLYLDEGTWTVTATKAGHWPAVGTVTVSHERRCSEPTYHSLELTLLRGDERAEPSRPAQPPLPPPIPTPAPATAPPPEAAPAPPALPEAAPTPPAAPGAPAPPETRASPGDAPPSAAFPPLAPKTH